eukprot:TRINITY_DN6265_c0_g2_i1.p1 TRINITY_DN6265_c0_g2~~TRINITY_DN6265_c0_g2_i1.p1  ORF type:complete len:745 (+),score=159.84 TRINITY_DN6265_c0_g2_i1:62-2236(+)
MPRNLQQGFPAAAPCPSSPQAAARHAAPPAAVPASSVPSTPSSKAPAPASKGVPTDLADLDESKYDVRTWERLKALALEKQECVEAEDYGGAKRCKEALLKLKAAGLQIRELEEQKKAAVENEEYDVAQRLKKEIERLRLEGEPEEPAAEVQQRRPSNQQQPLTAPRGAQQPMMASHPAPHPSGQSEVPGRRLPEALGTPSSSPTGGRSQHRAAAGGGGYDGYGAAAREASHAAHGFGGDEMPPTPSLGSTAQPVPRNVGAGSRRLDSPTAPSSHPGMNGQASRVPERAAVPSDMAGHPLAGVPNAEDLGQPDPLPVTLQKEVEPLCMLFGEYVVQCLYSKSWSLRDAALQKLALQLRSGEAVQQCQDVDRLLDAYATILARTVPDKNVQVFHSSAALLQAVCHELLDGQGRAGPRQVQASLEPLLPILADRLGDANARAEKTARDVHLDLARCSGVGAAFTAQCLLRPPKKKTVPPRVYSSRLQLLAALVTEFGVQPSSRDGIALEAAAQLAMDWFSNPAAEVRESAVRLIAACYSHVGLGRIERYLSNLRQAQREVFDAEFQRVSSGGAPGTPGSKAQPLGFQRPPAPVGQAAARPIEEPMEEEAMEDGEGSFDEFVCQFCGREDPSFTPAALDVHYWRECPMLSACKLCEQVIEISRLHSHWLEECEAGEQAIALARALRPGQCGLCRAGLAAAGGVPDDRDWQEHLLVMGCPANPRAIVR